MKRKRDFDQSMERQHESSIGSIAGTSFDSTVPGTANSMEELAGKIDFIHMINFMCHTDLKVPFNSRVTFITGRNGSGKSAIMVGLIVVLGGSTSLTNRGSKLTDLIKKGESSAKVTISLINEGQNSFKKEVYGSRIIISRSISSSGSNVYVCKAANGDIVSKKKDEVDSIVMALNLQIKNPICVLNQDVARNFLCSTDNTFRFSMFAKATQLENLKAMYMKTLELLVLSKEHLRVKQEGIKEATAEIQELREKLEQFEKLKERAREKTRLENEYFWALVADEEKKLKALLDSKNQLVGKKEEYTILKSNFGDKAKELEEQLKECQARLMEAKQDKLNKTEGKMRIQREIQPIQKQIQRAESEVKSFEERMERQLADINTIQEHLRQNEYTASQSRADKVETTRKIDLLRERLSEIKEEIAEAHRDLKKAEDENYNHSRNLMNTKLELGALEQDQKRLELTVERMKTRAPYNLLKFGQHTLELMEAIEDGAKKNYFHKTPVGPCGVHVRLTGDPKWARAVESVIGGLMSTYLCDNQKDFQKLSAIMEKICGKKHPPIIIGKFLRSRHNVEPKKVSARGLQSVLDVLSFDSDVVFNAFIDQARIETILLFETDQQAASVLTNIQNVPKNLKMGLTLQTDQYFPAPNYRTYSGNPSRALKYFDAVFKSVDAVKRLEKELREVKQAVLEKTSDLQRTREGTEEINKTLDRCKEKLKVLKHEEGKVLVELNHLRDTEETRPVVIQKAALEEELQTLTKKYKNSKKEFTRWSEELQGLKDAIKELAQRLNLAVEEEDSADKANTECEEKLEKERSKEKKLMRQKKEISEQLAEINQRLREVEVGIAESEEAVKKKVEEAKEICPERIETERSAVEVQKLLEECEKYLKAGKKMTSSRKGTIQEYKAKKELFKEMKSTERVLENTIEVLTVAAFKRDRNLDTFQGLTANLVSLYFQATLQTRGYDGALKVDFENKVLDLEVKPKDATVARKDSKTLSGGERSYSTMSFILAIWKVVHMPVYFLDEFDVFMDKVNRTVIIQLLLEHANTQTNKQFVFITPQDISGLQLSDTVAVYRLPDPKRKT